MDARQNPGHHHTGRPSKRTDTQNSSSMPQGSALERVQDGCCKVVRWNDIKHNPPANLKVNPISAIPHKSRSFHMILDLSFQLQNVTTPPPSVNDASEKTLASQHAIFVLGNVIPRLVHQMAWSPSNTPFMFTKIDLKDRYWRMVVSNTDAWNFAYVLQPLQQTDNPELAIPTSL